MRFFTSDEHYGHAGIIRFCKRPFTDATDMREKLIAAHNSKVTKGDITYHLGDMFWRTTSLSDALEIMDRLNGQHALVYGNHEELVEKHEILQDRFIWLKDIAYLDKTVLAPKIVLCHYAMRVWRNSHRGAYHLYGHSHAALPEANTLSFDCGVDTRPDYAPWSEAEIVEKMKRKQAAGAIDEMEKQIQADSWNKAEGAEVPCPSLDILHSRNE